MTGPYRFSAPWWAWLLTAALVLLFLRLGFWQIGRAEEKKAMISAYQTAAKSEPADVSPAEAPAYANALRVRGRFDAEHSLLLDNQVSAGRVGYHVWTPVRLDGGGLVLVDRGWVPMQPDRSVLPEFSTALAGVELHGVWQPLPRPGLRIGENACGPAAWPRVVQYPRFEELLCMLGPGLHDGVLWLDPTEPHGFVREWTATGMPPERHFGYAFQWFALALTLLVLFAAVNFRRVSAA